MANYEILYSSLAKKQMTAEELTEMLRKTRSYNNINGITGCLIYKDRDFLQFLEGEEEAVKKLFYEKIAKDKRHIKLKVIWEGFTETKSFNDWSMAFENLSSDVISNKSYKPLTSKQLDFVESDEDTTTKRLFINFVKLIKRTDHLKDAD